MTTPTLAQLVERQLEVASLNGEVESVMRDIVERLLELPGADGASLSAVEDDVAYFRVSLGCDTPLHGKTFPVRETLGALCLDTGELQALRATDGGEVWNGLTAGAKAIVLAPVAYDDATRGVLGVRSAESGAFSEFDVEAVRLLARSAAIALRNAELVARLEQSESRLQALVQTQQAIAELELDPDALTAAILERAQELAGADGASIQSVEGDEMVTNVGSGMGSTHGGLRLGFRSSLSGYAALHDEPVYSADVQNDPRADTAAARRSGLQSLICAPLHRDGRVVGALNLLSLRPAAFDEHAIEATRLMASYVSSVLRNADELESRRRLADELRTQSQLVEHMQTALLLWAPVEDGFFRLEYMNAACEDWTQRKAEDLVGRTLPEVLPAYHDSVVQTMREVIESNEPRDIGEVEYGDEWIRPGVLSLKAYPLPGPRVAIMFENVTERVHARRALQESESRFRSAFDSASIGMALIALDGRFVQLNDRLAEILGYPVEELPRMTSAQVTYPDDLEEIRALDRALLERTCESFQHELRAVRKDGSVVWLRLSVSRADDYQDEPIHFVTHVEDITERKESEALFAAVFERSVVPKLVFGDDRRLSGINDAGAELLGVPAAEAIGLSADELVPGEKVDKYWNRFVEAGTFRTETTLHRPDGTRREIEFVGTANVQPGRHIAVVLDLTAQKELEDRLRQGQKMEAVGRLAGGVAHDFNNLLTAIAGYSEFLIEGIEDERLRLHAEEIRRASARAASLTGQLLAFSRRQVLQPRVLDLNAVVSDMDMMLRRLIGEDVELVSVLASKLGPVRADPTQLEQVIVNLAVNARDAMPNGGSLTIETANIETDTGGFVELRLTDSGIGMTTEQRERLFEPFYTTKEGGTGLGLATVYGIVEQSGGSIEVDSEQGLGASFAIQLPRLEEHADVPAATDAGAPPRRGSETILLVEDEAVVRRLLAAILERSGYEVMQAGDGPSALELLRRHVGPVDLLLTDVVMPGMSGRDVAQAVTSLRPEAQVLYTSGYADSALGPHGVLEDGVAFLQKPFTPDELARKVRSLLDQSTA